MFECLLLGKTKELNIGHGAVEYIAVRPLIMPGIVKVEPHVQDAVPHGGRLALGGTQSGENGGDYFHVFTYYPMLVAREETFGGIEESGYETNHHQVCDLDC